MVFLRVNSRVRLLQTDDNPTSRNLALCRNLLKPDRNVATIKFNEFISVLENDSSSSIEIVAKLKEQRTVEELYQMLNYRRERASVLKLRNTN